MSSAVAPGTRLVVAIAPAFTIGFVRPSSLRSTAASELNGSPVRVDAEPLRAPRSGPSASQTSANTNGFETLMIVNSTSASPAAIDVAARADDADAEERPGHRARAPG